MQGRTINRLLFNICRTKDVGGDGHEMCHCEDKCFKKKASIWQEHNDLEFSIQKDVFRLLLRRRRLCNDTDTRILGNERNKTLRVRMGKGRQDRNLP